MNILDEIKHKEVSFMSQFNLMPTALELDVESYALLRDELLLDPVEDLLLWDSYKIIVNDFEEKRISFILSNDL